MKKMDTQDVVFTTFENQETARKLLVTDEVISVADVKVKGADEKFPRPI